MAGWIQKVASVCRLQRPSFYRPWVQAGVQHVRPSSHFTYYPDTLPESHASHPYLSLPKPRHYTESRETERLNMFQSINSAMDHALATDDTAALLRRPGSSLLSLLFGGALGASSLGLSALAPLAALVVPRHGRCLLLLRKQQFLELSKGVSHVLGCPRDGAAALGLTLAWELHAHVKASLHRGAAALQHASLLCTHREAARHLCFRHCCLLVFLLFITLFV
ncbi:hypothetical protein GWK47_041604 [Chionoecetes opilio]|uniref:Uncharacterized protein n=1 Tax=Chionoecetes opilio TaxID=41210 RepID=A0A8J4Y9M8_CHIOP|nr:hypothetical protein GWK47_041604 [Chionoecetes opilio]